MPSRDRAIDVLHTERNYQDAQFPQTLSLYEYLDLIEKYVARARAKIQGPDDPMEDMRKIGAVALRTIETWDAPMRAVVGAFGAHHGGGGIQQ